MKKVMLIDSDIGHLRGLMGILSKDFNILVCSRGQNAWDLFNFFKPDALVMDPTATGLDTPDFLSRIRRKYWPNSIPIIAMTRINTLKHIEQSFDWGADMVLSKPCQAEKICKKLLELLPKKETPEELSLV
jgi:DNA-binding response OmpR family regulator